MGIGFNQAAFTAGFNQGAMGVRESLKDKRDKDEATRVLNNKNAKEGADYVAKSNVDLDNRISGLKKERREFMSNTKLSPEERVNGYKQINEQINNAQYVAAESLDVVNAQYGTKHTLANVDMQTKGLSVYNGKNGAYFIDEVTPDGMDASKLPEGMYIEGGDNKLYISRIGDDGQPTGEIDYEIGIVASTSSEDKSGEYYEVDGVIGVFSKTQLKQATDDGKTIKKFATPKESKRTMGDEDLKQYDAYVAGGGKLSPSAWKSKNEAEG